MPYFRIHNSELIINNFKSTPASYLFRSKESKKFRLLRLLRSGGQGFTLIELLVVLAVIGILATIVLANYNNFGQKQAVKNAAAELKSNLRKYQTLAISGQKNPTQVAIGSGCNSSSETMQYYQVEFDLTNNKYRSVLHCTTANVDLPWVNLPSGVSISFDPGWLFPQVINFKPIDEGVELTCNGAPADLVYLELANSAVTYRVYVTNTGEINDHKQ